MILDAMRDLQLDLPRSILLGDSAGDIEAGRRAGVGRLWLLSGAAPESAQDVRVFADLDAARAALVY
jgi:D-glycero-D-manno-heptose 1,7-bisphosphate phosphatase